MFFYISTIMAFVQRYKPGKDNQFSCAVATLPESSCTNQVALNALEIYKASVRGQGNIIHSLGSQRRQQFRRKTNGQIDEKVKEMLRIDRVEMVTTRSINIVHKDMLTTVFLHLCHFFSGRISSPHECLDMIKIPLHPTPSNRAALSVL